MAKLDYFAPTPSFLITFIHKKASRLDKTVPQLVRLHVLEVELPRFSGNFKQRIAALHAYVQMAPPAPPSAAGAEESVAQGLPTAPPPLTSPATPPAPSDGEAGTSGGPEEIAAFNVLLLHDGSSLVVDQRTLQALVVVALC